MITNAEYEKASEAILKFRAGDYTSLEEACNSLEANIEIAEEMIVLETASTPGLKTSRKSICDTCEENQNNTCMQCACPMSYILYADNAVCPLGKW